MYDHDIGGLFVGNGGVGDKPRKFSRAFRGEYFTKRMRNKPSVSRRGVVHH